MKIGLLAGSIREGSYNRHMCAIAAEEVTRAGHLASVIDLSRYPLPIFAEHLEQTAFPDEARALKAELITVDALILSAPEYNGSITPLLKNAIDWSSRSTDGEPPLALTAWRGKPVALMAASPGPGGGMRVLMHLRDILAVMQALVIPQQVTVANAHQAFDGSSFANSLHAQQLDNMVARLAEVASALKG